MSYSINNHGYNYPDSITVTMADNTSTSASSTFNVTGNANPNLGSIYDFGQYNSGTGYNWTTPVTIGTGTDTITLTDYSNVGPYWGTQNTGLKVNGNAEFEGDVKIKGKSLVESLEKIEEKLAILRPNEELEAKWDQLRDLRKQYMELEKEIIEKEKVWDILKK